MVGGGHCCFRPESNEITEEVGSRHLGDKRAELKVKLTARNTTSGCLRQMAAVRVRLGVGMGRWTRQTGLGGELGGENCREMMGS